MSPQVAENLGYNCLGILEMLKERVSYEGLKKVLMQISGVYKMMNNKPHW